MDIRKLTVIGAIIITALGIIAIAVLAAYDRPLQTFVNAFLIIGGFLTAIIVQALGSQKTAKEQSVKLDTVLEKTDGINSALLDAVPATSPAHAKLKAAQDVQIDKTEDLTGH